MEGVVARRVIPSDNSCLFNVVYVMEHNRNKASELRQVTSLTKCLAQQQLLVMLVILKSSTKCFLANQRSAWILGPEKLGEFQYYQFAIIAVCWNPVAKMPSL
uniref:Uncharacterized protein n=1 Tax=Setaria viridis TaxID=4556 RepID=A0A4U6W6L6_SETVI|nr:hypothetical protein SEVIR_1G076001v2 [Setaria viridis]